MPQDLLSTFKELDRAGIGEYHNGAFKWNTSIKNVVEATSEEKPIKPEPQKTQPKQEDDLVTLTLTSKQAKILLEKLLKEIK